MRLALCIGINDYPGTGNDLSGCRNDADDWAAALTARDFEVRRLVDGAASGEAIRAGIRELLTRTTAGDAVVITYSGHGTWLPDLDGDEPDHRDEALCPHDVAVNGALLDDELHTLFAAAAPGVRTVLISDSCHSGTLTRLPRPSEMASARPRFLSPSAVKVPATPPVLARPAGPSALLLSGCRDAEYSYDAAFDGRPNGAFTYTALAALTRLPATATYRDWLAAIRLRLPSGDYPQTPSLQGTPGQRSWPVLS